MATGKKPAPKPKATAPKKADKPNAVEKLVQDVTNRYRVTAREARDIVTSVANFGAIVRDPNDTGALGGAKKQIISAAKNLKTQVKEVGTAAKSGKKGTPSKEYYTITGDQPSRFMTPTDKNSKTIKRK